jgi:hypothetical protein
VHSKGYVFRVLGLWRFENRRKIQASLGRFRAGLRKKGRLC